MTVTATREGTLSVVLPPMTVVGSAVHAVEMARQRIAPYIRRTPFVRAQNLSTPLPFELYLKLENMQITGSFKARGALNRVLALDEAERGNGLIAASAGNHALGLAYAGRVVGAPVTIYVPQGTPTNKIHKIEAWGAHVVVAGAAWDESNVLAQAHARREGLCYVHPFADADVIAGQGTLALEMVADVPGLDMVLVAIGGGGLISGVAAVYGERSPSTRLIGIEPEGAPTLHNCLDAGKVVELAQVQTIAGTLAVRKTEPQVYERVRAGVERVALVDDDQMRDAMRWLWFELGLIAEPSGAAAVAALLSGRVAVAPGQRVGVVLCGGNVEVQF